MENKSTGEYVSTNYDTKGGNNKMKSKSKMDISISLSRDYNKITLSFVEEEIEYEEISELKAKVRQKFDMIKGEIELQFEKIGGKK